jgi:RND family efflux transporter MFP subunit
MDPRAREPRRAGRRTWLYGALALLVLAAGAVLARSRLPWFQPEVETATVQTVTPAQASAILAATGYTYARRKASVGAKIVGRIIDLRVDEGDTVKANQVIALLDNQDLEAAVREAEARLAEARAQLADARREKERREGLLAAEAVPQETYDAAVTRLEVAEAQVKTAEAELAAARARLDYAIIRSPLDGVVIDRNVELGEMVAPGGFTTQQSTGSIVRIADPASLEVEADINESYIARLELGQPALIQVDAVPDHLYHGRLRQIVPTGDRQKAVVEVKVTIDDRDRRLVPDMSCTVTFLEEGTQAALLQQKPTVLVPRQAVRRAGAEAYVFKVQEGRLRRTPVVVGEERGDQYVVVSGLQGGETVVRGNLETLEDGQRVRTAKS